MNQKKLDLVRKNLKVTDSLAEELRKENLEDNFDPEIFDFVITLNALGFMTTSSCQGHIDELDLTAHILICNNDELKPIDDFNLSSKQEVLNHYNNTLNIQKTLNNLLDEFYQNRSTPMRYRLLASFESICYINLESNSKWMEHIIKDEKERIKVNNAVLKEVHDFNDFLKTKIK